MQTLEITHPRTISACMTMHSVWPIDSRLFRRPTFVLALHGCSMENMSVWNIYTYIYILYKWDKVKDDVAKQQNDNKTLLNYSSNKVIFLIDFHFQYSQYKYYYYYFSQLDIKLSSFDLLSFTYSYKQIVKTADETPIHIAVKQTKTS